MAGVYAKTQKHDSACEKLKLRAAQAPPATSSGGGGATGKATGSAMGGRGDILFGSTGPRGGHRQCLVEARAKSSVRPLGANVGRETGAAC